MVRTMVSLVLAMGVLAGCGGRMTLPAGVGLTSVRSLGPVSGPGVNADSRRRLTPVTTSRVGAGSRAIVDPGAQSPTYPCPPAPLPHGPQGSRAIVDPSVKPLPGTGC